MTRKWLPWTTLLLAKFPENACTLRLLSAACDSVQKQDGVVNEYQPYPIESQYLNSHRATKQLHGFGIPAVHGSQVRPGVLRVRVSWQVWVRTEYYPLACNCLLTCEYAVIFWINTSILTVVLEFESLLLVPICYMYNYFIIIASAGE